MTSTRIVKCLPEAGAKLVALHEVEEVGSRLPVLHRESALDGVGEAPERHVPHEIVGSDLAGVVEVLAEQAVAVEVGSLRPAHHPPEAFAEAPGHFVSRDSLDQRGAQLGQIGGDIVAADPCACTQETDGVEEVVVVVVTE